MSAPCTFDPPACPLPKNAPQHWRDLWESIQFIHPEAPRAFMAAYEAGVDPQDLCAIQLATPKDLVQALPRLWFGPDHLGPCRIFSPAGEVTR